MLCINLTQIHFTLSSSLNNGIGAAAGVQCQRIKPMLIGWNHTV